MKSSKIEWKDTKLPFCIDEEYPLAVRIVLVQEE